MTEKDSYFMFKLVSGEEIVAITSMDDSGVEPCFYLADPLKVELTHKGNHTMVRLVPWITILDEEIYKVNFDKIITMTELEPDHDMIQAYDHYNHGRKNGNSHKVKVSERMGYKGNVENARINLAKIFVNSIDNAGIST